MGSMFSSSSKEEIDMALSKVKDIVSSTPVVVFREFELFGAFKNHPWNGHEHLIFMPQHSTSSIDESNVTEFKTHCQYCKRVKQLLSQLGANYKVIELDEESDGSEIQSALEQWTGQRTVPNVFIGGKHVGGCDAVTEKHQGGKLLPLLMDAGYIIRFREIRENVDATLESRVMLLPMIAGHLHAELASPMKEANNCTKLGLDNCVTPLMRI